MSTRPSNAEIAKRIEAMLKTRRAGQAVADCLERQSGDWAHRAVIDDLRLRRIAHDAAKVREARPAADVFGLSVRRLRPI